MTIDPAPSSWMTQVQGHRATWLVTGAAGFIGSNLVEALLQLGQRVIGLDNFATGHQQNLEEVRRASGEDRWGNFSLIEADIRDRSACDSAVKNVDYVLHQAALGSVPRSIVDPITTHDVNVTGFLNMLEAARNAAVKRFVYAASSSTYGDDDTLPKREEKIGNPLSPYAVTKLVNELYSDVYARTYNFPTIGLRYFNVFGPRQDPNGAYAAVIPKWTAAMIQDQEVTINGDGETSRDFCYVANAVQANLRAALSDLNLSEVFNIAVGERTSLNELFQQIRSGLEQHQIHYNRSPIYGEFQLGDVRHSQASIDKAVRELGYHPTHGVRSGLAESLPWYIQSFRRSIP